MKKTLCMLIICLLGALQTLYGQHLLDITRVGIPASEKETILEQLAQARQVRKYGEEHTRYIGYLNATLEPDLEQLMKIMIVVDPRVEQITLQDSLITVYYTSGFYTFESMNETVYNDYNGMYERFFEFDEVAGISIRLTDGTNITLLPSMGFKLLLADGVMQRRWFLSGRKYIELLDRESVKSGAYHNAENGFMTKEIDSVMTRYREFHDALEGWDVGKMSAFLKEGMKPIGIYWYSYTQLLDCAAAKGDWDVFKLFLDYDAKNYYSMNYLLDSAVQGGNVDIVRYVLEKTNCRPDDRSSSLTVAAKHDNAGLVELLLPYMRAEDSHNEQMKNEALLIAAENGNVEMAVALIDAYATVNPPDIVLYQQYSPLHYAAMNGSVKTAKLLLDRGADINAVAQQVTSLYLAAENGNPEVVELLVDRGADMDVICSGSTPLCIAVERGHYEIAAFLLQKGADADLSEQSSYYNRASPLARAAANGDLEMMKLLMSYIDDTEIYSGVIGSASDHGHPEAVQLLLDNGAEVGDDATELMWQAVWKRQPRSVAFWLSHGVDPNVLERHSGVPLIMAAANVGDVESMELLTEGGADIDKLNRQRATLLMCAASGGSTRAIEYLLAKGSDLNAVDYRGSNALHYAADGWAIEGISLLVDRGVPVDSRNRFEETPLMLALKYMYNEMEDSHLFSHYSETASAQVKALINCGADVNARDFEGMTPLMYAVRGSYTGAVKLLLDRGADLNAVNTYGDTPVAFFNPYGYDEESQEGAATIAELLGIVIDDEGEYDRQVPKIPYQHEKDWLLFEAVANDDCAAIESALAAGANALYEGDGISPMRSALERKCSISTLMLLVGYGAYVDATNWNGTTALMRAVMAGNHDAARYFIEQGADVNRKNSYDNTALIFAAKNGDVRMIRLLVDHGADVNIEGNSCTPLSMARSEKKQEAVELLESLGAKDFIGE